MKVLFTARHFTASQRFQDYSEESVSKLEKYFDAIHECNVIASPHESPETPQQIEISLKIPGTTLIVKEASDSYETAILKSVDNLKRQLIKHKEKQLH